MKQRLTLTKKQKAFIEATEDEVLFGGAAGGGKSFGQIADALIFAIRYPGSKQLILRRTFAELDKSLIRLALGLYPKEIYSFNQSSHTGKFQNGSLIDFGYCQNELDVYQYQSAEYDVIRFDELTHFTESQYLYLISRVRGANSYPKQVKSTTNPGGIGHGWVKARFVDPSPPLTPFSGNGGLSRIFIPSLLEDNKFLTEGDPDYEKRLLALPERERRALLYGDWSIFEGQYFTEFDPRRHVIAPFEIPVSWRKFRTIDYGLDCLACLWIAVSPDGKYYVYRELCKPNLTISAATAEILARTPMREEIYATLAPPDLWARSQESGRTKASLFSEYGMNFTRTDNNREVGWLAIKELLISDRLFFFDSLSEIIKDLPSLVVDRHRPSDCQSEPHEITHAPDALRGFAIYNARPPEPITARKRWLADMWEDYAWADDGQKKYLIKKYGEPN